MAYRPQNKTIRKVVDYLASIGLSVYGDNVSAETGEFYGGCADYDAEKIIRYREFIDSGGEFWVSGGEQPTCPAQRALRRGEYG